MREGADDDAMKQAISGQWEGLNGKGREEHHCGSVGKGWWNFEDDE